MATTPQTFSQSALGSSGTPTISGNRVQIIQDGETVGYRETVTITNPSVLNQGARLIEGANNDRTPSATYTLDYGLDGRLQGGTLVQSGGLTNPAPVSYTINSNRRFTPTSPNTPVPAEMANIQLPDYSPFRFSDQTGALAEGLDTAYGGNLGRVSSFVGNRIDAAAIGSSALAGDTRGVQSEGAGVIGSGVALAAGEPLIVGMSAIHPVLGFLTVAGLAYVGNTGGKVIAQSSIFNPTYDGYQWHDGSTQPWRYDGETITRPAGWYQVVPNPRIYQGGRADPIKTEELNQRAELVATVRIQSGDQAADLVSRMNNDQLRSFVAQNPTHTSVLTINGHLTRANIGATPDDPSTLPASAAQAGQLNVMNGLSPSGFSVGTTLYVSPGPDAHSSAGGQSSQPVVQVTTYRDEATNAVMEVRVTGHLVNGNFVANPNSASAFGMTAQGNVYVNPGFQVPTVEGAGQPTTTSSTVGLNLQPVSVAQGNVLAGLTPTGLAVGQVFYTSLGAETRSTLGGTTTQPVVQTTTYRDPITGTAMEVRIGGHLVNGSFVANPDSTSSFGMDPRGNVVVNGETLAAPQTTGGASGPSPIIQVAPNATQSWTPSVDGRTVNSTTVVRNGDGTTTTITTTADRSTGRNLNEVVHETRPGGVPQLVSATNFETGAQSLLNRDTGQMEFSQAPADAGSSGSGGGSGSNADTAPIPRAPSSTFVHNTSASNATGGQTVTLAPGGTVSDVVLLQNRAGNPITADDVRAANPDLNINAAYSNVRAGDTLVVPTRVGDNLVTTEANGDVRSVNTRTGEVTTVVNHGDGTSTQTSSTPDEFGRTERVVVYDRSSGEVVSEQRAYVDSSTGERTPLVPQEPIQTQTPTPTSSPTTDQTATTETPNAASPIEAEGAYAGTGVATGSLSSAGTQPGTQPPSAALTDDQALAQFDQRPEAVAEQQAQPQPPQQSQPTAQQWADLGTTLGTFNTIMTLGNWDQMTDLQRAGAVMSLVNGGVGLYNIANDLRGDWAPEGLFPGEFVAGIGFLAALESGNAGAIAVSGLNLANTMGWIDVAPGVIPGLNFVLALDSGDPVSIVSSGLSFASVVGWIPGWGQVLAIAITVLDAIFGNSDIPTIEGEVQATWDQNGQLGGQVIHDAEGGGERAQGVFESLLSGFTQELSSHNASTIKQWAELHIQDPSGQASNHQAMAHQWALNPSLIPQVGYYVDPDGDQKEITLTFTNEQGEPVTQRYDLEGNRINAVGLPMGGPNLGEAFGQQTQGALAPSWLIDGARMQHTPLAQEVAQLEAQIDDLQQEMWDLAPRRPPPGSGGQDYSSPNPERYAQVRREIGALEQRVQHLRDDAQAVLNNIPETGELYQAPQVSQDGLQQNLRALTLTLGEVDASSASSSAGRPVLANLDGDAYLEQVNWVQNNQALLGIDLDGDGRLQATELLTNNLDWLDANHDGRIDAKDPAFTAIRLWVDINGDASNLGYLLDANGQRVLGANGQPQLVDETTGLTQSGISAIELGAGGASASIVRADGSSQALTEETLSGDTLGVKYSEVKGALGVMETTEQLDGSGKNMFYAQETGLYDGKPEHLHGGEIADERWLGQETIHAGDARLQNIGGRTIENSSVQTHTLLDAGDAANDAVFTTQDQTKQAA